MRKNTLAAAAAVLALIAGAAFAVNRLESTLETRLTSAVGAARPTVILDAGHGGADGGASVNGVEEKNINLTLALNTAQLCRLFGFDPVLTRDGDYSIHDKGKQTLRAQKNSDLHNRLALMTSVPGAVAISLHLNKYRQSSVWGAQMFYSPKSSGSRELAQLLQQSFCKLLQPDNHREIKKADSSLYIIYNNTVVPAVMVECGFLSNPPEAARLCSADYQKKISMTVCYSILKFYNREEPENGDKV